MFHAGPMRNVLITENMFQNSSQVTMEGSNVVFKPYHTFKIVNKNSGSVVLSVNNSVVTLPDGLAFTNLTTPSLTVKQVRNNIYWPSTLYDFRLQCKLLIHY